MGKQTGESASAPTGQEYNTKSVDDKSGNENRQNKSGKTIKALSRPVAHLLTEAEQSANKMSLISEVRRWRSVLGATWDVEGESISELVESLRELPEKFQQTAFAALENLFARDAAEQREKTLQFEVINILTDPDVPVSEKFFQVVQLVGKLVPFQYFSVNQVPLIFANSQHRYADETLYSWERGSDGNYQVCSYDKFLKTIGCRSREFAALVRQLSDAPYLIEPRFYAGADFKNLSVRYDLIGAKRRGFGFQSGIYLPIEVPNRGKILLVINSTAPDGLTKAHFDLLVRLLPHIKVGLENICAFEDIAAREKENALQIAVADCLTRSGTRTEKLRRVAEMLATIFDWDIIGFVFSSRPDARRNICFRRAETGEIIGISAPNAASPDGALTAEEAIVYRHRDPEQIGQTGFYVQIEDEKLSDEFIRKILSPAAHGYQSAIQIPVEIAGKGTIQLTAASRISNAYQQKHLELLQRLAAPVSRTIEKLIADEEIRRQLIEITELKKQLELENTYLVEEVKINYDFEEIVGSAPALQSIFRQVELVAPTDATVLLEGETGTGKELFARAIHNLSARRKRPLIKVNCASLPAELIESELFGHERGSFTGAYDRRIGKFELANEGTIFLDEVAELPLNLQAKLLRVLQEGEIERVGGSQPIRVDLRIIAATNRRLHEEVAEKRFRSDLYYRLNTALLTLPPLRERREDVTALAQHFVKKYAARIGKNIKSIASVALKELSAYDFPGNVRELEHIVEEAVIFSKTDKLELHRPLRFDSAQTIDAGQSKEEPFRPRPLDEKEREYILKTLRYTDGRVRGTGGAAELLRIKPTTLESRMKKLGIEKRFVID
jgi:formate hydrogenlyase transcriptional activator